MYISLIRLILYTKTNINFIDWARFILENHCKVLTLTLETFKILIICRNIEKSQISGKCSSQGVDQLKVVFTQKIDSDYIGKPMQISLNRLILYWKVDANLNFQAHFMLKTPSKVLTQTRVFYHLRPSTYAYQGQTSKIKHF